MSITEETRRESYQLVDTQTLYQKIVSQFKATGKSYTARDLAVILYEQGLVQFPMRQAVAPRLTELEACGTLEVCGKAYDELTRRKVALYRLAR